MRTSGKPRVGPRTGREAMKFVDGDLITLATSGSFDVIAHGCNCMCTMGAGIAISIRQAFPQAWDADRATTKGDRAKLGTCTVGICQTGDHELHVVNAYTQYDYQGNGVLADYAAITSCMAWIKRTYRRPTHRPAPDRCRSRQGGLGDNRAHHRDRIERRGCDDCQILAGQLVGVQACLRAGKRQVRSPWVRNDKQQLNCLAAGANNSATQVPTLFPACLPLLPMP